MAGRAVALCKLGSWRGRAEPPGRDGLSPRSYSVEPGKPRGAGLQARGPEGANPGRGEGGLARAAEERLSLREQLVQQSRPGEPWMRAE